MSDIITRAIAFMELNSEERSWITISPKEDIRGSINGPLVEAILHNVISNSIKHLMETDNPRISITYRYSSKKNCEIVIEDNGPGIEENKIESIFDYHNTDGEGTGLGLGFCRESLDSIGGSIKCKSMYGQYTKMIVNIPVG